MQKYSLFLLLFCLVSFTACEDFFSTVVELELPEVDEVLVLNSIAKVNEPIIFDLSKAQGILEDGETYEQTIENGTISLYKDGNLLEEIKGELTLRIDSFYNGYQVDENGQFILEYIYDTTEVITYKSNVVAEAGATYEARATAPNFEEVRATTTMPNLTMIKSASITDTSTRNVFYYGETRFIDFLVEFDDNANEENYYFLSILQKETFSDEYSGFENVSYRTYCFTSIDPAFVQEETGDIEIDTSEPYYCSNAVLLTDGTFNGQNKKIKVSIEDYTYWGGGYGYEDNRQLEWIVNLGTISKDFFLFKKSAYQQAWVDGNPFAEPVQVYSNTDNGFGVFAGYSMQTAIVE